MWVCRDRAQLYERINERVLVMIKQGWIDECKAIAGTRWEDFIRHKKLIGYAELLDYLQGAITLDEAVQTYCPKDTCLCKAARNILARA